MGNEREVEEVGELIGGSDQLSLAQIGLIALIDEATGYQNARDKDALRKTLQKYKDVKENL